MSALNNSWRLKPLVLATLCLGLLGGCVDEAKTNTNNVTYTPEERPLGVIGGADIEASPGSQVVLGGRLIGTTSNQKVIWELLNGDTIEGISDWTVPNLSFTAPTV